jgi:cytochrome c556
MQGLFRFAAIAAVTAIAMPAAAQFAKPEDAIKYRQSAFTVMATHFGRVAAMANGRIPFDAKVAAENAEIATTMSKLPFVAFIDGTDKGNTKAKPEIWTEKDKVAAAATKMQEEMAKLNAAAKGATSTRSRRPSARRDSPARPATTSTARNKARRTGQLPFAMVFHRDP